MHRIRAVFRGGHIEPLEPVNLPENTQLHIAVIAGDDVPSETIASVAHAGHAFDFLEDSREDLYSESDGEPV